MVYFRHRHALMLMLLALLVAAALRFPDLSTTPPGLHYDEAANAILSAEIGLEGERPIFISSYTGKEVMFFYLAGGLMRLVGESVFTLRLTAVFISLLTIAATYWLGVEAMRDRRVATLAATLLALSFWYLLFSRLGFRAITQPLMQAITVAALLRGLRRSEYRWLFVAGIGLGLAAYTYLAVRLFPVLLLIALMPLLLQRHQLRIRSRQLGAMGFVALAVASPLIRYFVQNPDAFWVRITQVAPGADGLSLGESYWRSLHMFFVSGDPYIRFNLPDQPLFGWFWGSLLVVGWLVTVWRWRQQAVAYQQLVDWQRFVTLLLLLTPFFMILPTAMATNEIVPSNLRAIGLIPFIFYLPAIGLMALLRADKFSRTFSSQPVSSASTLILLTLAIGLPMTVQSYFVQWAERSDLYFASDADLTALAQFLDETDTQGKIIYVSALHYQHPTVAFLSQKYDQVKWLPESEALPFAPDNVAIYLFPHNSPAPEWGMVYLETAVSTQTGPLIDDTSAFTAYELATPPAFAPTYVANVNFGDEITLLGYDAAGANVGEQLQLTLYWRIDGNPSANFTPFVHLEDEWGYRWSQVETFAYPAAQWERGETVVQRVKFPVTNGTPPGNYRMKIGLFDGATGNQLARLDDNGRYAGNTFLIENVPLSVGNFPNVLPLPPIRIARDILPGLQLIGFTPPLRTVSAGEPLAVSFYWQARKPVAPLWLRLEMVRPDGMGGRILSTTHPVHDTLPFSTWTPPQFVIDWQETAVPDNIDPGEYRLQLRLLNGIDDTIDTIELGTINVTATTRLFSPPPIETPLTATFGGEINLLGYNLTPIEENSATLELVWQAEMSPTTDYTVFVHLLTVNGRCDPCIWQQDSQPQQGQSPTSRWQTGEVVVDTYQLIRPPDTPSGTYPIEIGLYIAETGQRLQVTQLGKIVGDVVGIRPLHTTSP